MTKLEEVAKAMEARRRELIAQPLNRIWPELAEAAVKAIREPSDEMTSLACPAGYSFEDKGPEENEKRKGIAETAAYSRRRDFANRWRACIDTILSEKEQGNGM